MKGLFIPDITAEMFRNGYLESIDALMADGEIYDIEYPLQRRIPVTERLPEEKINPITEDYSEYQCTVRFGNLYDVRSYKYGEGHWRLGAGIVDDFVIAWMPLSEPYKDAKK